MKDDAGPNGRLRRPPTELDVAHRRRVEKHVTFPPKGLLPLPGKSVEADRGCDVWDLIFDAALLVNPAFNIYRIFDTVRPSFAAPPSLVR